MRYQASLEEEKYFLQNGTAPPLFHGLDKKERRKRMHTLCEYAKGFVYDRVGKLASSKLVWSLEFFICLFG